MTKNTEIAEVPELVYQVRLPLSTKTVTACANLLRRHLIAIGSPFRTFPPGKTVMLVLAVLRCDHRLREVAEGNGVSPSTIHRWVWELLELLAGQAPRLDRALAKITAAGGQVVLLDGTLVRTRRRTGTANRKNYSGKHKTHMRHEVARFEWLRRKEGRASMRASMSAV